MIMQYAAINGKMEKKYIAEVKQCIDQSGMDNVVINLLAKNIKNKNNKCFIGNEKLEEKKKEMIKEMLEKYISGNLEREINSSFRREFRDVIQEG